MAEKRRTKQQERPVAPAMPSMAGENLRLPALTPTPAFPIGVHVPEARQQTPAVGQRVTRPDGRLHGLGQTKYIDDLALPGMLYAKIKRAGIASARITQHRHERRRGDAGRDGRAHRERDSASIRSGRR